MNPTSHGEQSMSTRTTAPPQHARRRRRSPRRAIIATLALSVACTLAATGSLAAIYFGTFTAKVTRNAVDIGDAKGVKPPTVGEYEGGFNLLLVGVDNDPTQSKAHYGPRDGTLNDVNILLHVSADHSNAVAVSLPRDLVIPLPSCLSEDGSHRSSAASALPLNNAWSYGGLRCVVDTVEQLSGLEIPFAGAVTFDGTAALSDAVGGVDVCVTAPIDDIHTGLNIPAGHSTLQGADALAFVRTRYQVGDGSDLGRISSQQVFMSSLVRKIKSDGTLGDPGKLARIAEVASDNMKLSTTLANPLQMVSIALALRKVPLEKVAFVQYPGTTGADGVYTNKVKPSLAVAAQLWAALEADRAIALDDAAVGEAGGSTLDPSAPSTGADSTPSPSPDGAASTPPVGADAATIPGLHGQTAAQQTCTAGRG
jgi:LCP family protein required for cell wall assembly